MKIFIHKNFAKKYKKLDQKEKEKFKEKRNIFLAAYSGLLFFTNLLRFFPCRFRIRPGLGGFCGKDQQGSKINFLIHPG